MNECEHTQSDKIVVVHAGKIVDIKIDQILR